VKEKKRRRKFQNNFSATFGFFYLSSLSLFLWGVGGGVRK
jgi:hypothetical protein